MKQKEPDSLESSRLIMEKMRLSDFAFINELLNTEGFLKYIGDRNIRSDEDAKAYIAKILENPDIQYWVVYIKSDPVPMGIVSLVKRDYLPLHDIGYAFLPRYMGRGFAFEAARALTEKLLLDCGFNELLAVPNKCNTRSVRLLGKLRFSYKNEIEREGKIIQVYSISKDGFVKRSYRHELS